MIEIKPMDESYIHLDCLHNGPVDPELPPTRGRHWFDAPDLPPHPWSDETIVELARKYDRISEGWTGDPAREFMREMIHRYGTCAILVWEKGKVVGHLRFYPLTIAQLLVQADPEKQHLVRERGVMVFEPDPGTLWVQCVMTCRPYVDAEGAKKAGARRGLGLKLAQALLRWARENGWRRIFEVAHCDLDWFYGIAGASGKTFWEKAGFKVVGKLYKRLNLTDEEDRTCVQSQMTEKGMTEEEVRTWYRMAYDL